MVVADWKPMLQAVKAAIGALESAPASIPPPLLIESIAFLEWLERDNFTFLGVREFELSGDPETADLVPVEGSGLGVLRDASVQVLRRGNELVAMTPEMRRFFFAASPLIITKANVVSKVHRRAHMDYIGIKTYRADGTPKGEIRVVGLFTSQSYFASPTQVPFLRHKVDAVLGALGYPPSSHDGKAILNILESFPRDELFQIGVKQLGEWVRGHPRPGDAAARARVRPRRPLRPVRLAARLCAARPLHLHGARADRRAAGGDLRRTHRRVLSAFHRRPAGARAVHRRALCRPDAAGRHRRARAQIVEIIRTWEDRLVNAIAASGGDAEAVEKLKGKYRTAFSAGYAETFAPERALEDIKRIERLGPDKPVAIDFYSAVRRRRACRGLPLRSAHAVVRARADPGEPRLLGHRRAHLSASRRATATVRAR